MNSAPLRCYPTQRRGGRIVRVIICSTTPSNLCSPASRSFTVPSFVKRSYPWSCRFYELLHTSTFPTTCMLPSPNLFQSRQGLQVRATPPSETHKTSSGYTLRGPRQTTTPTATAATASTSHHRDEATPSPALICIAVYRSSPVVDQTN